jgi:hypothetical protein
VILQHLGSLEDDLLEFQQLRSMTIRCRLCPVRWFYVTSLRKLTFWSLQTAESQCKGLKVNVSVTDSIAYCEKNAVEYLDPKTRLISLIPLKMVLCSPRDGVPLKSKKNSCRFSSLAVRIICVYSRPLLEICTLSFTLEMCTAREFADNFYDLVIWQAWPDGAVACTRSHGGPGQRSFGMHSSARWAGPGGGGLR